MKKEINNAIKCDPNKPFFPGQEKGEKVIFFTRRHPLSFLGPFLFAFFMVIVPFLFYWVVTSFKMIELDVTEEKIVIVLGGCYLLFVLGFFLAAWIDYYMDVMILTDFRIVDITQNVLFSRTVAEANLSDIEDVNADVKGVLPTIFHYGTVFVQTAGTARNFEFQSLPDPYGVSKMIVDMHQQSLRDKEIREGEEIGKSFANNRDNGEKNNSEDIKKEAGIVEGKEEETDNTNQYQQSSGWKEMDNNTSKENIPKPPPPQPPPPEPEEKPKSNINKKNDDNSIGHDDLEKGGEADF